MPSVRISSARTAASLLGIIALAAFMPSTSRAGTVSATYNFDAQTLDGFQNTFSRDFSVNAAQFNSTLGKLNSIEVVLSITLEVNATSQLVGDSMGASGGGGPSFNSQGFNGFSLFAPATSTKTGPISASDTEGSTVTFISGTNISPANFDGTIGTGTVPFDYLFSGNFNGSSDLVDPSVTTSGSVKVSYDFSPNSAVVSMPSSLKTSLLGLAALGLFRLRKTAKNSIASEQLA
jgi:hypothetical protein